MDDKLESQSFVVATSTVNKFQPSFICLLTALTLESCFPVDPCRFAFRFASTCQSVQLRPSSQPNLRGRRRPHGRRACDQSQVMAQKRGRRRRPLGPLIMTAVFSVLLTLYLTTGLLLFGTRSVMMQFVDKTPTAMGPSRKDHNGIRTGVLSQKKSSYFQAIQQSIDGEDPAVRCARYRSQVRNNTDQRSPPRFFFGSLVAEEPWELLEIVAAESYGIYHAIVLVEANRTQNFTPRPFKRLHETKRIQQLFGVQKVQVRPYVNEIPNQNGIWREQDQRAQILKGWKDLGMQPHDIGVLGDLDETFTRDFLRAAQTCQFPILDYQQHYCEHSQVKVIGQARVFEASPECIQDKPRRWLYPGMIVGQCLEEISDPTILNHPKAPRKATDSFHRERGWGVKGCNDWGEERKIKDNRYPLFSAADFRKVCAGGAYPLKAEHFGTCYELALVKHTQGSLTFYYCFL